MDHDLRLQPVRIATGPDEDGMLVFAGGRLVAVLVRLSDAHEDLGLAGHWFLETSYGLPSDGRVPAFPDLDAARTWIGDRLLRSH